MNRILNYTIPNFILLLLRNSELLFLLVLLGTIDVQQIPRLLVFHAPPSKNIC